MAYKWVDAVGQQTRTINTKTFYNVMRLAIDHGWEPPRDLDQIIMENLALAARDIASFAAALDRAISTRAHSAWITHDRWTPDYAEDVLQFLHAAQEPIHVI